jgi:hypothetical protein
MTSPSWGFSLALSGMMMPPRTVSPSSTRRTKIRSWSGVNVVVAAFAAIALLLLVSRAPPVAPGTRLLVIGKIKRFRKLRSYNGKPIADAHVIFHPIQGDRDTGALELKTNEDGKATIDVIPIGDTVTLQVIANGFQTYGQVFKIDKSNMTMDVRLKRPVSQYSVYKNSTPDSGAGGSSGSGNNSGPGNKSGTGNSSGSPPSSPPPDSGSKSSGSSGGQSDPPPSGSQSQPPPK